MDKQGKVRSLTERGQLFVDWLSTLKQVASDATKTPISEVKINEEEAFKYYKDGFTPTQCFREEWQNDGD